MFGEHLGSSRWRRGNKLGYEENKSLSLWELMEESWREWFHQPYLPLSLAQGEIEAGGNYSEKKMRFYLTYVDLNNIGHLS